MAKWKIQHIVEEVGVKFRLQESALLRSEKFVPVANWGGSGSSKELAGLAHLVAWTDEDFCEIGEDYICVPHDQIAMLRDSVAYALQLPEIAPYTLNLQNNGTLDQPTFKFRATWLQQTGQPLLGAKRLGAFLSVGNNVYRVPEEIYQLLEATEAFNAASDQGEEARLYYWSLVQELLPDETARSIKTDGYIQSTRIAHAAAFSLDFKTGVDGFTVEPILFSSKIANKSVAESDSDESIAISDDDRVLPDVQHEVFAEKRFAQFDECQARYALGDGWYVVIDAEAQAALNIVRKIQKSDREKRRQFARNPRAFLRKELGDSFDEATLERLFIETSEYSDRVSDVGLWEKTVLPWVQKSNDPWLPEKFGLKIGESYINVEPVDVPRLREMAQEAVAQGQQYFLWGDVDIPASGETLQAIQSLVGLEKPEASEEPGVEGSDPAENGGELPPGPIVLVVDQNLNEVEYTRTLTRRAEQVEDEVPVTLKSTLKNHQVEGLRWLKESWASGSSGILLADDMGLGKTLQALTFLAWLRERMEKRQITRGPILMVAPVGLLKNWREEVDLHFHLPGLGNELIAYGPDLKALRAEGGREIDTGEATLNTQEMQRADWVLTTYETLRDYQHSFGSIRFSAIVYDEVQKIKTPGTLMTVAAQAMNGDFVLALTGTPVENRLADLWCIMDTLQPGALGGLRDFSARYEKDPTEEDLHSLKDHLMQGSDGAPACMLRRMKAGSLQGLPDKHEHVIEKTMPKAQADIYTEAINRAKNSNQKGAMLKALQDFRSISLHPTHPDQADPDNYIADSARLSATFDILDEISKQNHKALIFLESLDMQPVLAGLIQRRYRLPNQPMLISGKVSGAKRQDRVNEFQKARKGFDVIILSPRAGGVGLTLTAANHVIHLSRWWNPAVEDQCTDRVYRIGQDREVHVYYPLAIHPAFADSSFDLRLHSLLEKKRSLSREMLMPPIDPQDTANLYGQTVGTDSSSSDLPSDNSVLLDDIDAMEPIQFENWVLEQLKKNGFEISRTPRSYDGGGDGIAKSRRTGSKLIIQCKHTQSNTLCDEAAVTDLVRARTAYGGEGRKYLAITNARDFSKRAHKMAAEEKIRLVSRADLGSWPDMASDL